MNDFLFTVPSGEPVTIEPFHYAIVGQTQFSGKTTLIKRLSQWAIVQGFKVLIFDTKETEADYAGFGREVPVCLRETTDSFVLIGLLEGMFKRRLTPYYATLSRITEGAEGFDDIIERAKEREAKTRSSWLKDACRVLYDLLERLKSETAKVDTVPKLTLYPGVNRMVINDFSLEAQQLIVKNSFEDLLHIYKRKTVGVLDEAFKFIPQGYSSPATRSIMQVMTQGAKTGLFGWISTQFLAATDKGPLKACAIKFLGTQDHITEVKHTMDLIPEVRGKYSSDDVMKLKLGHWILVRKRPPDVRVVYSLPLDVPKHLGRKVASGELTPERVRDRFLVSRLKEDEKVWREKSEKLQREMHSLENERSLQAERIKDLEVQIAQLKKMPHNTAEVADLKAEIAKKDKAIKNLLKQHDRKLVEVEAAQRTLDKLREAFSLLLPVQSPGFEPGAPSEVTVATEQPAIAVVKDQQPLTLKQADLEGRIAIVYAEGLLPSDKAFTLRQLNRIMECRFGTKEFPGNLPDALNKFVAWGYLAKVRSGRRWDYRVKLSAKEAKDKGLLKEVEGSNTHD